MYLRRTVFSLAKKCNVSYLPINQNCKNSYSQYVGNNYNRSSIFINSSRYSSDNPLKCWNCSYIYKSDLFCSKCKVLQEPPENLTYFNIMDIPVSYDITASEIQAKYKELQKLLHPDKFSTKSEKEKQLSENLSSLVNKAYSTLLHPLKRGLYMLKLNNIMISEETDNMNAEFLMEIMEINEELEDAVNDRDKIKQLMQQNETVLHDLSMHVSGAFKQKDIKKAESLLIKMKYYYSIHNRLKKLKHDLGIVE